MTQQEQQEFAESLEAALSWMRAVQEQLRANDNTQGPRDALEARLRETEKIHQSECEGRVKMDAALVAAESLLQSDDDGVRSGAHARLKELKSLWEETCTYIIHCHSRIEWVWLHWGEYLKASEELEAWLARQRCRLEVGAELQLGLKEKLWQVDQEQVVVSDAHSQGALLERLLDEAAALHNRTQDPSLDPRAQERLREAYGEVRDRAQERLALLKRISEDHQVYQTSVQRFQSWILTKTRELTSLMEQDEAAESKLRALQVLDDGVAGEEKTLQHIEGLADAVRANTSPAGAAAVQEEAEELRLGWQRLRQGLLEAGDGLRCSLDAHDRYLERCRRLGSDIGRLRLLLQGLDRELEDARENRAGSDGAEDQMVGRWKRYTGVRNTVVGEESQVEQLKAQLKELFRFSQDSRRLSDDVLAVVREHHSVKSRATRLVSESELGLRSVLQDPLLLYAQWSQAVATAMEAPVDVSDSSGAAVLLQKVEGLLEDGVRLQERLALLQAQGDLLTSLFGPERSDGLQEELGAAVGSRRLLQEQLLQQKTRLQGLLSRTRDFEDACRLVRGQVAAFRERLQAMDATQPDILAKRSQLDRLLVLQKDLQDFEAQVAVLETQETQVPSSQPRRTQLEKLREEWEELQRTAEAKAVQSEEAVGHHEDFDSHLLSLEKWTMVMRQKLESFCGPAGRWSVEGRQHEAERALAEFPEKEQQLHRTEVQAQVVLDRTSADGRVHILRDLEHLRRLWVDLYNRSLNLHRLLSGSDTSAGLTVEPESRNLEEGGGGLVQDWTGVEEAAVCGEGRGGAGVDTGGGGAGGDGEGGGGGLFTRAASSSTVPADRVLQDPGGPMWVQFQDWLSRENQVLSDVLSSRDLSHETAQETLQALRSRVSWGQDQFQLVLQERRGGADDPGHEDGALDELRYRWMLYKSKLKDGGDVRTRRRAGQKTKRIRTDQDELVSKPRKKPGLLGRVCRLALLLWLLLLALLLLAFLLPLLDDSSSCSLSNNFARSFSVMLRYDGPPPT